MDKSVYVLSQWETMLHFNVVSYWLSAYTKFGHEKHPGRAHYNTIIVRKVSEVLLYDTKSH